MSRFEHDPENRRAHASEPAAGYAQLPPRPSSRRPLILIMIGFGVLLLIALTRFGGASATIGSKGIGPLKLGQATRREMQNWARGEVSFWQVDRGNPPVRFAGELWKYDCINTSTIFGQSCRTLFGLRGGHLATVMTTNPLFFTAAGTHIGMPLVRSLQHERGRWSGWDVKCPHVVLPAPKGVTFLATVAKNSANPGGFITGFYLSKAPGSFAFCD
jgi:hypothetical protein